MGVLDRLGRAIKAAAAVVLGKLPFPASPMSWGWGWGGWATGLLPNSRRNYAQSVGDGLGSTVIVAVVMWIVRAFPEAPLRLTKADGTAVPKHPMLSLLARPNPFYSGALLWMATLLSYVLNGNAYWIKLRNGAGIPVQLWYVPHFAIEPMPEPGDPTIYIAHYRYMPEGASEVRLDPRDVVHFRFGLDPRNIRKGFSLLGTVLREVFTDDEAANFTAALLNNMGVPGLLVSPKGDESQPSTEDVEAVKVYLKQQFTGDHRGEPLVMSGPTEVSQFGFTPAQMDLKALRRIPEERVSAVLGVPAIVAGLGAGLDRSTFANYAEAREAAYESNIIPTQRLLAEELTTQLLVDFESSTEDLLLSFDNTSVRVLQPDQTATVERVDRMVRGGWMTVKRGKELIGEASDESDDYYLRPINVTPVLASEPVSSIPPAAVPPAAGAAGYLFSARGTAAGRNVKADVLTVALMRGFAQDAERGTALLTASLAPRFTRLGERARAAYARVQARSLVLTAARNGHSGAHKDDPVSDAAVITAILGELALPAFEAAELVPDYRDAYGRMLTLTVETVSIFLGVDIGVDLQDPDMLGVLATGGRRVGLLDLSTATREALFAALRDAREEGEGPEEVARRIQQYVSVGRFRGVLTEQGEKAAVRARAQVIARTETKYAQNVSSLVAYQKSEVVSSLLAFDNQGSDTGDSICAARNGNRYTFEEAARETEEEHPNGTLSWAPLIE